MKFGSLLSKAKDLVANKGTLSKVVDEATDLIDTQTKGKFSAELAKLDGIVENLKPSDLDQLGGLADKLDDLDPAELDKLKDIVGQLAATKGTGSVESLDPADLEKLKDIAGKLGIAPPR